MFVGVVGWFNWWVSFAPEFQCCYFCESSCLWGWSGGAKVLGKLPVPGRPTILITVGQGPTALAVGAGGGCLDIFTLIYIFSSLSPSLWETARYRLKYCLKGPLNPKQPTNQPHVCPRDFFPPCRGPGAQFSLGTSLNDSDCSHWEELSGGTTRLPWVASRKPEERILEVEKYPRDLQMFQHTSLALISV